MRLVISVEGDDATIILKDVVGLISHKYHERINRIQISRNTAIIELADKNNGEK